MRGQLFCHLKGQEKPFRDKKIKNIQTTRAMSFFEKVFGFRENTNTAQERLQNIFKAQNATFNVRNGNILDAGSFAVLSLTTLREIAAAQISAAAGKRMSLFQMQDDFLEMHRNAESAGGVFQCASKFNCLVDSETPGISGYENLRGNQGAACAIACPAGAAFRYYIINVGNGVGGQPLGADFQINCADDIDKTLKELILTRRGQHHMLPLATRICQTNIDPAKETILIGHMKNPNYKFLQAIQDKFILDCG